MATLSRDPLGSPPLQCQTIDTVPRRYLSGNPLLPIPLPPPHSPPGYSQPTVALNPRDLIILACEQSRSVGLRPARAGRRPTLRKQDLSHCRRVTAVGSLL